MSEYIDVGGMILIVGEGSCKYGLGKVKVEPWDVRFELKILVKTNCVYIFLAIFVKMSQRHLHLRSNKHPSLIFLGEIMVLWLGERIFLFLGDTC